MHNHILSYTIIHNHIKSYTIIHYHTLSCTIIHNHTLSYTIIHNDKLLYTIIHYYVTYNKSAARDMKNENFSKCRKNIFVSTPRKRARVTCLISSVRWVVKRRNGTVAYTAQNVRMKFHRTSCK